MEKNGKLRTSIVIPVRNRADLLRKALRSLVEQDMPVGSFEIIVCNDGSDEDLQSAFQELKASEISFKILNLSPRGPAAARNSGIRASNAEIITFVDSDVVLRRDLVRKLVGALDADDGAVGAEAKLVAVGGSKGVLWDAPEASVGGGYHTAAIAYRRKNLEIAGGFDETFKLAACEDVELAARMLRQGTVVFVPDAIAEHPRRKVNLATHIKWRKHWRYQVILSERYGIKTFPSQKIGAFPRVKLAFSAVITLPAGRFLSGFSSIPEESTAAMRAIFYSIVDFILGVMSIPEIFAMKIPDRLNYIITGEGAIK